MNKKIKNAYIVSAIFLIPLLLFAFSTLFSDSAFFDIMFAISAIFGLIVGLGFIPYSIYMIILSIKVYKETKDWKYILISLALIVATVPLFICWVAYHQV